MFSAKNIVLLTEINGFFDASLLHNYMDVIKNSEISTLKKHEIKEVFLEDHQLKIILHITGNEAGYYVESGADEMTVSLYKTKNKSLKSNKLIPYDGVFTIDLIEYPRLKNIYIAYSPN